MLSTEMRSLLITMASAVLTTTVIGNAFYQKKQFYPSVVYITKSNPSMAIIYIQAFVVVLLMGKLMRKIFFGQLRTAEMEHLIEKSWYAVTETCLAFTVFRDDLSPKFVALFTLLLFLKCFHWLAEDRVDYMERSPNISLLFHIRVISLLFLLGSLDFWFIHMAYYSTLTKGASVQLVFGFEYAILFAVVFNILMKYVLHFVDLQNENPWEDKAVYLLYTELMMGFLKVILYLSFITIMMKIHTFPLFAIRPMYLSMRAFKKALNDVIMSRRAIRNMNTLYPDATSEDLQSSDNVCIICREEMTGNGSAKKLPCNHMFHISCLRSWFQRQQTCPTCRMDVLRNIPNVSADNVRAQQQQQQQQQQPRVQQPLPPMPQFFIPPNWQAFAAGFPQQQPNLANQNNNNNNDNVNNNNNNNQTNNNNNNNNNQTNNNNNNNNNQNVPNAGSQANRTTTAPSFIPFPPFVPFMAPPMPTPPQDLSRLSLEELRNLEGQERQNVEARIRCLRNVQTLVEAALLQLQQYNTVTNQMTASQTVSSDTPSTSGATATTSAGVASTSSNSSGDTLPVRAPNDPQEILRQRRLQRFSQTQPPIIDSNTETIVTDQSASQSQASNSSNQISDSNNDKKT
ncbi:E3 ubiquitin-protein ligase synoviolin B-like [Oppia nitens]|uniref:E3 ubiquitin-protein ligase synoviolin B-like n=1 Tax=Oppia nitens TaxID=1686743 RepID=UPI0023DB97F5|nr:E3 ubiquitin-protein ligase synoviolin B-like [Oppia nitens]